MTAATSRAPARVATTSAWVCAPPPTPWTTCAIASPSAVAGSSQEFTLPGSDRFQSQAQPSPDASDTTAITATARRATR